MACPDIDITQYLLVLSHNQLKKCGFLFIFLELWRKAMSISGQTMGGIGPKCKLMYILLHDISELIARLETNCIHPITA